VGSEFDETIDAAIERVVHRLLVKNRLTEISPPIVRVEFILRTSRHRRDYGDCRAPRVKPSDLALENMLDGLEPAGVIGEIKREFARDYIFIPFVETGDQSIDRRFFTGQGHLIWRVVAANLNAALRR